jgi:hypothetical protein
MGVMRSAAQSDWAGSYTLTFQDGKYGMDWQGEQGQVGKCEANYQVAGDIVRLTHINKDCDGGLDNIQWRIDDKGLHIQLVATKGQFIEQKAFFGAKPLQKVK